MPSIYLNQSPPSVSWNSPALSVVRSNGPAGDAGTIYTNLNPVFNPQVARGMAGVDGGGQATGIKVQLWAYAFGTAPASNLFLSSLSGMGGATIPDGGPGMTIASPLIQPFDRDWDATTGLTPDEVATFINADGNVHCCLYGNVYSDTEGQNRPTLNDLAVEPFDPAGNRRHAQTNCTIMPAPAGTPLPMMLWAGNSHPKKGDAFDFQVIERSPRELMVWEVEQIAEAQPWLVGVEPPQTLTLGGIGLRGLGRTLRGIPSTVTRFVGLRRIDDRIAGRQLAGVQALVHGRRVPLLAAREPLKNLALEIDGQPSDVRQTIKLDPDEARPSILHFDVPTEEFVTRVVDVVQRGKDGAVVGGARVILIAAPTEVIRGLR